MAKFDSMSGEGNTVHYDGDEYFRPSGVFVISECWHCGQPTKWISINFQAFLCSTECADAKWHEYQVVSSRK